MTGHRHRRRRAGGWSTAILFVPLVLLAAPSTTGSAAAAAGVDQVDEVHAGFGDDSGSIWIYWHGHASTVSFGPTTDYGRSATPHTQIESANPYTQIDVAGPIERALLSGLSAGTTYHYRIDDGADHQVRTAPTGDFTWDDVGDTGTTLDTRNAGTGSGCDKPWMSDVWAQIAAEDPDFVTHGGDISYANECGVGSIHQFYEDIAPVATRVAWEQTWGNHEYGPPNSSAPPGTLRDSMANYKSRNYIPNPQTVPTDTTGQVSNPGCPSLINPKVNGCLGQDWGWFVAGHVLFITEPEPWVNARADWGQRADALMAAAENDPSITFIVTTGHRPAYTSTASQGDASLRAVIDALGDKYSPTARADGKYVLNLAHHVHGGEVFAPQHGVVHITNGGGGTEQGNLGPTVQAGSMFRTAHFEHLHTTVTSTGMRVDMICGPVFPADPIPNACTTGSVIATTTIPAPRGGPPPPPPPPPSTTEWVGNPGLDGGSQRGWTGAYNGFSRTTVQPDGAGNYRLRIATTSTTAKPAGVNNANPNWVTATTVGTAYTATAQAQAGVSGQQVVLLLREVTPAGASVGSVASRPTVLTNTGSLVALPTVRYIAKNAGDTLKMSVYVTALSGSQVLYLDNLSLTSPA